MELISIGYFVEIAVNSVVFLQQMTPEKHVEAVLCLQKMGNYKTYLFECQCVGVHSSFLQRQSLVRKCGTL